MSRKFKSQASSARAASNFSGFGGFQTTASPLSYITEQPDLSQVSEPNVVVALKNLGKKDSTTKSKALDELLDSLKDKADVAVLTAWSELYPRTSIDNSQIVRRNAHVLQGTLTSNAGKKIAPFLPKLVPSWLAGTFDSDKSVAKSANDALNKCFATPEKRAALCKLYQDAIYERVEDALLVQSATTLSDERTTSPDEAQTKYVRVVGTAMRLLSQLLDDGLSRSQILQENKLWDFAHHEDSYLRNAVCGLLRTALSKNNQDLDWTVLSTSFLYKGLHRSQTGSSRAYAQALCKLTDVRPTVWTSEYTAKTASSKRLLQYLRQGAQNGPQDVWPLLAHLVQIIPQEAWNTNADDVNNMAEALKSGVLAERIHIDAAWTNYVQTCAWLSARLATDNEKDAFVDRNMAPILSSYVNKSTDDKWRLGGRAESTAINAAKAIENLNTAAYEKALASATDSTIEKMRLSLPESSKDFRPSQDAVAAQGKRLMKLQQVGGTSVSSTSLLDAAIDLLRSRNGKPYGAASIVDDVVARSPAEEPTLKSFLDEDLDKLMDSPSCEHLVALAVRLNRPVGASLLHSSGQSVNTIRGTEYFLRHVSQQQIHNEHLQPQIIGLIDDFNSETSRVFALSALANPNLEASDLQQEILSHLLSAISSTEKQQRALSMLEAILAQSALARNLSSSGFRPQLVSKLLILADSADPLLSDRASALSTALGSRGDVAANSLPIIRQQLSGEGEALSILTLTDLALKSVATTEAHDLLPNLEDWQKALQPHLSSRIPSSLTITSALRGAAWAVEPSSAAPHAVIRDAEDFSLLFRIAFFVTKVFVSNKDKLTSASGPQLQALYEHLPVALQLINEKVTLDAANDIWLGSTDEVLTAASDVLSEGSQLVDSWQDDDRFSKTWLSKGHYIDGVDREEYLNSLAFLNIISSMVDRQPKAVTQEYEGDLTAIWKSENILQSSALLAACGETLLSTQAGLKVVNELIADLTQTPSHFNKLLFINLSLQAAPQVLKQIPQQRLVFLFKKLVSYLRNEAEGSQMLAEGFGLVAQLISFVQDIYGDHWEALVSALVDIWGFVASDDIAILHPSLLVFAQLKKALRVEEVNDDLQEAVSTASAEVDAGLLHCLQALSTVTDGVDQPRSITAELLRRQLVGVKMSDDIDLYALLGSSIPAVRSAAFDILHKAIPEKQEQISIDLVLEQKVGELPAELLQLIADAGDAQRYLLSWKIAFDHYRNASHQLREAYTANLKSSSHVGSLLDFLCEKLRIASGRPIDASKFNVADYDLDLSESVDHDIQWLSIHLYYLAVSYIPSLVKDWFLSQKNRIKTPLESWTQKHMTPLIVSSSLATVTDWSAQQDKDDRPVEIKASSRGSEVIASIAVDPESPPISLSIALPPAYPLESPVVTSRARVGVSEKNWTSWLRTIQIIIFSSGSIIEGLIAFRRNVQGALKGQSECAICYSIIGTDMQTPNKKCGTCKNNFHGVCLFRWFKSSNSSSCPLCRNNFNYA